MLPLYKVTALRLLMTGKAKDTYEMWESEHTVDEDSGYQEILDKVRDYARSLKLDHSAKRATKM